MQADARGECHATANFNTGVLYLRSTQGARRFTALWAERMAHVGPEPWLDDQSVLNDMVRQGLRQLPPAPTQQRGGSRLYSTTGANVTIGLLPLAHVANGHTFLVQLSPYSFALSVRRIPPFSKGLVFPLA